MVPVKKSKAKILLKAVVCAVLVFVFVIHPIATVVVYETVFGNRYQTDPLTCFSVEDYDGLQVERSDFQLDDVTLAGYKYSKEKGSRYYGKVYRPYGTQKRYCKR